MHQMMGYDRAINLFSPDGRLLQVEYAKKTVKQGSTAIGITYKDGVLIMADKRINDKLIVTEAVEKIFKIDGHIIATASGIISDARVLVEYLQKEAQNHKFVYDHPIDVLDIVVNLANVNQLYTQSGGSRPFGVSLIIGGVDSTGKNLFVVDPTGIYVKYYACAIGEGGEEVSEFLRKHYKENMSEQEALTLAIKALKSFLKDKYDPKRIDAWIVDEKIEGEQKIRIVNKKNLR